MFLLFFTMWLLLAGNVTLPSCLWGVAVSALMHLLCYKFLGYRWHLRGRGLKKLLIGAKYLLILLAEMLKAGVVVMGLIYTKGRHMEPELIWFDSDLKGESARAVLANSITLTAGTITVEEREGRFCIHTLDRSLAEGIENCGFQRRLGKLEE